jgi:hypothetical protein
MRAVLVASVIAGISGGFAAQAMATDFTFFAILNGGNEVSSTGQANAGDPDAYGSASVVFKANTVICYSISVVNIATPTLAHIHEAKAGVNGPIVVPLTPPPSGNPGVSSACISIDPTLWSRIRVTPANFYINVHNGAFPGGAMRGQLF